MTDELESKPDSVANNALRPILLIEDDADLRDTVCEVLEDRGYQSLSAGNGAQALELLRATKQRPCVILLDLMMPVMDGWQFLQHQKADPEVADIPVVVLTAYAATDELANELKVADVLRKPVELGTLLDIVGRYCARNV